MSNLYFQISALFSWLLIASIYFPKSRVNTFETKMYSSLIVITFFALITDITIISLAYLSAPNELLEILNKFFFSFILIWISSLSLYIVHITFESLKKIKLKIMKVINILYILFNTFFITCIFCSNVEIVNQNNIMYSTGKSLEVLLIYSIFYVLIILICVLFNIFNFKRKRNIKMYPIYVLIMLILLTLLMNKIAPEILLTTPIMTYIVLIMYFTIENPDIKLINELNIAREMAVKANNSKTDFLSSMSHEIRTPLNAVVGFSESLLDNPDIKGESKEDVRDIISASNILLDIVNSVLDISKIEANKLEISNREYNSREMINELLKLTKTKIRNKPIQLKSYIDSELPEYLYGDNLLIKQIILNLLTNSAKYTKKGEINFKVNVINNNNICKMIISVEDTGVGVKPKDIDKLFNKFERIHEGNTSTEGTGLGLAITKKLVNLMGGKIVVQSKYGEGSKFTVAIAQNIVTNRKKPAELEKTKVKIIDNLSKRVIVIDDNKLNLKVAVRLLEKYDIKPETVTSGFNFIEKIKEGYEYDLVFLDDMMPDMSGTETLIKLKKECEYNMPTVMLTANAIEGMKEKYIEAGFDDYLAKPIKRSELSRIISKYLYK